MAMILTTTSIEGQTLEATETIPSKRISEVVGAPDPTIKSPNLTKEKNITISSNPTSPTHTEVVKIIIKIRIKAKHTLTYINKV